jgi:O-antigen/teichoic acid export membrane protein
MSIKQKTISGLFWSFVDAFANQGIQFIVGIILARLLSPREFGLIGMLTIFIAISQTFVDSGFSNALIRKTRCTQNDYSTTFYFNIIVAVLCYMILFVFSGSIASFFHEPQLRSLIQILGICLIANSFSVIQRTILTKEINFKLQTMVSLVASIGSGIIAVYLALTGFGVWSLVALTLSRAILNSIFLWLWGKWKPNWVFSRESFKELFAFGSKLLVSGLIDTAYRNVYYLIIGKYFSAVELGQYTRADQFQAIPSQNLNGIIGRVSYPILSSIQDDIPKLKIAFQKIIKSTMFITFSLMLGMAAVAKPMIFSLIGGKWSPAVIYLQLLCLVGMFYPLHALNLNMLQVQGRSDLFLRLEIIKKVLAIPTIIIGVIFGIKIMIMGMLANSMIAYYLNSYWSGRFIGYSTREQIKDILPSFILATAVAVCVYFVGHLLNISDLPKLIIQIMIGGILTISLAELFLMKDYLYMKEIVFEKMKEIRLFL